MTKRLLIVEDDYLFASSMRAFMSFDFEDVVVCGTFAEGLREIDRRKRWDAAIFDLMLAVAPPGRTMGACEIYIPNHLAGCILAIEFLRKFPAKKAAVWSGMDVESHEGKQIVQNLQQTGRFRYFSKYRTHKVHNEIRSFLADAPTFSASDLLETRILHANFCGLGIDLGRILRKLKN